MVGWPVGRYQFKLANSGGSGLTIASDWLNARSSRFVKFEQPHVDHQPGRRLATAVDHNRIGVNDDLSGFERRCRTKTEAGIRVKLADIVVASAKEMDKDADLVEEAYVPL